MTLFDKITAAFILLATGMASPCRAQKDDTLPQPLSADFGMRYGFHARDVISQPSLAGTRYGRADGGYTIEQGAYRSAQAPQRQRDMFFSTEGVRAVKKFLTSGSFSYTRSLQDSVAYTLRNDPSDPAPYYYYSARPGQWEQVRYRLQGMISHPLMHDRLTISAGIDYSTMDSWRRNDPRSEYFKWDMLAGGAIRYRILPKHSLAVGGSYIKRNSDLSWAYRNENNATVNIFRTYLQDGYGTVEPLADLKSGVVSSGTSGYEWQGLYEGRIAGGTLSLKGKYRNTNAAYYRNAVGIGEKRTDYGQYNDDIYTVELYWRRRFVRHAISLQGTYSNELGRDYNIILAGNNYVYSDERMEAQALWTGFTTAQQPRYELGVTLRMADQSKLDGIGSQRMEYQYVQTALSGAYYFYLPAQQGLLKATAQLSLQSPLHTEAVSPVQTFNFTAGVPLYDYYFYGATVRAADLGLLYQLPLPKAAVYIRAQGHYAQADIPAANPELVPVSYPGRDRWSMLLGIGVTL